MSFSSKLSEFFSGKKASAGSATAVTTVIDVARPVMVKKNRPSSRFLSKYTVARQLQILGVALIVIMLIVAALIYRGNRESAHGNVYIATAGEMRMLSQRLAKASIKAMQGNAVAFAQLRDSYGQFSTDLQRLNNGGELDEISIPPSPENVQAQLQELTRVWSATEKNTVQLLDMESYLVGLSKDAQTLIDRSSPLFDQAERVAALKLNTNGGVREVAAAHQLATLTQRIARHANVLLTAEVMGPQIPAQIATDADTFRDLLTALIAGSEPLRIAAVTDGETRTVLKQLESNFNEYQSLARRMLANSQRLLAAKQAAAAIFADSEALLRATDTLAHAYQQAVTGRVVYGLALGSLILLALATLAMMARIYLDDTRRQAELAEQSRRVSETINRQNQDAILRLMNELGDLADGDLTVTATVSEDITGAIADSINYTIEELRVLVGRINDAAGRVTIATGIAQQTSAELLDATKRQSQEIQETGRSVLVMANSMTRVS
ncbi:MAG: methyl-accepting chemotaxis protein, partial [Propionivibrio sp.]